jgi:hypothetical protein
MVVDRIVSAVAEIVTGARIRSAKGLFSPPVRNSRNDSCARSNSSVSIASRSLNRWFSGKIDIAIRFEMTLAPMARKQRPSSTRSPR